MHKVHHHVEEVQSRISTVNTVIAIGIREEVKVLVGGYQCIDHFHGVLIMHVVVS